MGKKILIVDDDPAFRQLVISPLRARGHEVLEAGSLAEATALLVREPDLLLVDGLLPDGYGDSWLRGLSPPARSRPSIFVSARWSADEEDQALAKELGAAVVHKPVTGEALAAQIDQALGEAATRSLPPELRAELESLRIGYRRVLPDKLAELLRVVQVARAAPTEERARTDARTLAHRLAGTAGSYGFTAESALAALVEAQALAASRADGAEADARWAQAEEALAQALRDPRGSAR